MQLATPQSRLKQWFLSESRDLPWRHTPSPYAVWISEVMLQQTQVAVVLPYYIRWMARFPTVKSLAEAPLDEAIKLWEGLGYYSRVRNLHEGAKQLLVEFGGQIPCHAADLIKIKGIGPYTVGAILSFAFHQKAAAVDGNVVRVLSRYAMIEDDISKPKTIKSIWGLAESLLPNEEPWIFNEALIELGATVCTRQPKCMKCPLKNDCKAFQHGKADSLPYKSTKTKIELLHRSVAVIRCGEHYLVRRGQKGNVMADLHEFPYFETTKNGLSSATLQKKITEEWSLNISSFQELPQATHSFTRYRVFLNPILYDSTNKQTITNHQWLSLKDLSRLAFSSGHRRILANLMNTKG